MEYDLIVVGAGPGGSTCAYEAARRGLDVLLLDKRQSIGEPVRCAEGITEEVRAKFAIPDRVIANTVESSEVISPAGESVVTKGKGHILERIASDKFLAIRAVEAGAELFTRARAVGMVNGEVKVKTPEGDFKAGAPLVVGADGRESNVGRWFGLDTTLKLDELDKGFQYEMVGEFESDRVKFFLGREVAPGGYVWVFPKSERRANVGVCIPGDDEKTAKHYLDNFVKANKVGGSVVRAAAGTIPMKPARHELCGENFMLVGDAARLVNPIHGGGMEEAMKSGKLAGELAAEGTPELYGKMIREMQKRNRKLSKLNAFFQELSDEDIDFLVGHISSQGLARSVGGRDFGALVKIVKEKPSLLRFVPKLL